MRLLRRIHRANVSSHQFCAPKGLNHRGDFNFRISSSWLFGEAKNDESAQYVPELFPDGRQVTHIVVVCFCIPRIGRRFRKSSSWAGSQATSKGTDDPQRDCATLAYPTEKALRSEAIRIAHYARSGNEVRVLGDRGTGAYVKGGNVHVARVGRPITAAWTCSPRGTRDDWKEFAGVCGRSNRMRHFGVANPSAEWTNAAISAQSWSTLERRDYPQQQSAKPSDGWINPKRLQSHDA